MCFRGFRVCPEIFLKVGGPPQARSCTTTNALNYSTRLQHSGQNWAAFRSRAEAPCRQMSPTALCASGEGIVQSLHNTTHAPAAGCYLLQRPNGQGGCYLALSRNGWSACNGYGVCVCFQGGGAASSSILFNVVRCTTTSALLQTPPTLLQRPNGQGGLVSNCCTELLANYAFLIIIS